MKRSLLYSLVAMLVVVISASDLYAGRFRRQCRRKPTCVRQVCTASQPSLTRNTFPPGNNAGKWYPYGF